MLPDLHIPVDVRKRIDSLPLAAQQQIKTGLLEGTSLSDIEKAIEASPDPNKETILNALRGKASSAAVTPDIPQPAPTPGAASGTIGGVPIGT